MASDKTLSTQTNSLLPRGCSSSRRGRRNHRYDQRRAESAQPEGSGYRDRPEGAGRGGAGLRREEGVQDGVNQAGFGQPMLFCSLSGQYPGIMIERELQFPPDVANCNPARGPIAHSLSADGTALIETSLCLRTSLIFTRTIAANLASMQYLAYSSPASSCSEAHKADFLESGVDSLLQVCVRRLSMRSAGIFLRKAEQIAISHSQQEQPARGTHSGSYRFAAGCDLQPVWDGTTKLPRQAAKRLHCRSRRPHGRSDPLHRLIRLGWQDTHAGQPQRARERREQVGGVCDAAAEHRDSADGTTGRRGPHEILGHTCFSRPNQGRPPG